MSKYGSNSWNKESRGSDQLRLDCVRVRLKGIRFKVLFVLSSNGDGFRGGS